MYHDATFLIVLLANYLCPRMCVLFVARLFTVFDCSTYFFNQARVLLRLYPDYL